MNGWELTSAVLLLGGLAPALVLVARGSAMARLVGLELAGSVTVLLLLLLAQAFGQTGYQIVALVLVLLDVAGTLVFIRLLRPTPGSSP